MTLRTFFAINAVLAIGHGLGFILMPSFLLGLYQLAPAPGTMLMGQLFGAELLVIALIAWYGRALTDAAALTAIVLALLVSSAVGTLVSAKGLIDGVFGPMGWLAIAIYLFLTVGYLYFYLQPTKRVT